MELFAQATTIMTLGMAVTFAFLGVVIAGIRLSAWIIHRVEGPPREQEAPAPPAPANDHRKVVAAIAAALFHKPSDKP